AEDGIRDRNVTGVQTCALPILSFVVLIVLAFAVPILFKNQITTLIKKQINKSLRAKVDFKEVSLSLFRHFPRVSISLSDLSFVRSEERRVGKECRSWWLW